MHRLAANLKRLATAAVVAIAAVVFAGAVHVTGAHALALPSCGAITQDRTLSRSCAGPLTVGASGISIDFNGVAVVCDPPGSLGIYIPAGITGVRLDEALAPTCNVLVAGNGNDVAFGFEPSQAAGSIDLRGDRNRLHHSDGITTRGTVVIDGDRNAVGGFDVFDSPEISPVTVNGNANLLVNMTIANAPVGGLLIRGSDNLVRDGLFENNFGHAVEFTGGNRNSISGSEIKWNDGHGIVVYQGSAQISQNTVHDNGGSGIVLLGRSTRSLVHSNTLGGNYGRGIAIEPNSSNNRVTFNVSTGNFDYDLYDNNRGCDADLWAFNTFSTANQGCIH